MQRPRRMPRDCQHLDNDTGRANLSLTCIIFIHCFSVLRHDVTVALVKNNETIMKINQRSDEISWHRASHQDEFLVKARGHMHLPNLYRISQHLNGKCGDHRNTICAGPKASEETSLVYSPNMDIE